MRLYVIIVIIVIMFNSGCAGKADRGYVYTPSETYTYTPASLQDRQMQSRVYENISEQQILSTSVNVFQDIGVQITELEVKLGLVVGTKEMAVEWTYHYTGLFDIKSVKNDPQRINYSLVTKLVTTTKNEKHWVARLTIQRELYKAEPELPDWHWLKPNDLNKKKVYQRETIMSPEVYQMFFDKMDKALFLEKNI